MPITLGRATLEEVLAEGGSHEGKGTQRVPVMSRGHVTFRELPPQLRVACEAAIAGARAADLEWLLLIKAALDAQAGEVSFAGGYAKELAR